MNNESAKARAIFISAIENCAPERWGALLDEACCEDAALRRRVERLLRAHQGDDSFLDRGDDDETTTSIAEGPGTVIGPYKLVQQIGEGGFGVVFLAEQQRPVRRKVALKVIKPGMDTRQVIGRFEAERQALAMMDHPNIAKGLDAGTTDEESRRQAAGGRQYAADSREQEAAGMQWNEDGKENAGFDSSPASANCQLSNSSSPPPAASRPLPARTGRPYFVMELVHGVPITEYCDECNLTTNERLELFVSVCQAVQHAHQKGIIHRDLKPTNVLVAMQDGRPAPKIIDFGVAKALNQRLTEYTQMTAFAQMVGTPLYMSPEQAELSPMGVDTRSDIYSLGVLLYELLTSETPFDKLRLHEASYDEMRRIIREEEPPRPSARISTLAADLATTIAEHRRTDVRRLRQTVCGELDWIAMKCLEKDRNRRYDSAGSLARDIERYLHDEPVLACPPSATYRLKKFIRRNRIAAAFVLMLLAAVAALTVSNIQTRQNERRAVTESAKAIATSDLLLAMLDSADPEHAKGSEYPVRELLDEFSAGLGDRLKDQPEAEAAVRLTIGNAYRRLGLNQQAQAHLESALQLRRKVFGDSHEMVAECMVALSWNVYGQGDYERSKSLVQDALKIYERGAPDPQQVIRALWRLECILVGEKRFDEAAAVAQQALDVAGKRPGIEYPDVANVLHSLAGIRVNQGRNSEAATLAQKSVELHRRLHPPNHPETAYALQKLGQALKAQGKLDEAADALQEALDIFRKNYGLDSSMVTSCLSNLKSVLQARGDRAALEALARQEAEKSIRSDNAKDDVRLARLLLSDNPTPAQRQEARRFIRQAIDRYGMVATDYPDDLKRRLSAAKEYVDIAQICVSDPEFVYVVNEAYRRLMAELEDLLVDFPNSTECQSKVAERYRLWGYAVPNTTTYLPQVEHCFGEAARLYEKLLPDNPNLHRGWFFLGHTTVNLGAVQLLVSKTDDARATLIRALDLYNQHGTEILKESYGDGVDGNLACIRLAEILLKSHSKNESDEARRLIRQAIDGYDRMAVDYPDDVERRVGALNGYVWTAGTCAGEKVFTDVVDELNRRLDAGLPKLLSDFPNSNDCQSKAAWVYRGWGTQLFPYSNYLPMAEHGFDKSIQILKQLAVSEPQLPGLWLRLCDAYICLGDIQRRSAKTDDAEIAFRQAKEVIDQHAAEIVADATPLDTRGFTISYLFLSDYLVREGRLDEAAEYLRKANRAAESLRDPEYVCDALFAQAFSRLRLGDEAGYRKACAAFPPVSRDNASDQTRIRRLWTWCFGPHPGEDVNTQLREAQEFATHNSLDAPYCDLLLLGGLHQFDRAAKHLNDSIAKFPNDPPFGHGDVVFPQLFLAMTQWQQGQHDEARNRLADIEPAIDKYVVSPMCPWFGRSQIESLRREAEALIGSKESNEAQSNDNQTPTTTDN